MHIVAHSVDNIIHEFDTVFPKHLVMVDVRVVVRVRNLPPRTVMVRVRAKGEESVWKLGLIPWV